MRDVSRTIVPAVELLARFAPDRLEALRADLPDAMKKHLQPGGVAGGGNEMLRERAKVQVEALQLIERQSDVATRDVAQRVRRHSRFRLAAQVTTVVGSSSVLGLIQQEWPAIALVAGLVTLFGAVATIVADHVGKLPLAGDKPLFEVYKDLLSQRQDAAWYRERLEFHLDSPPSEANDELRTMLLRAARFLGRANTHRYVLEDAISSSAVAGLPAITNDQTTAHTEPENVTATGATDD